MRPRCGVRPGARPSHIKMFAQLNLSMIRYLALPRISNPIYLRGSSEDNIQLSAVDSSCDSPASC